MIPEPVQPPDRIGRAAAVIFAAATLQFLYLNLYPRFTPAFERNEPMLVARSLAEHGAFADPYPSMATGPTAHLAPAWPAVLALFFLGSGGGVKEVSMLAILATSILWGVCLVALPVLSRDLWGTEVPGWIGVSLGFLPVIPATSIWEATPTAAALAWSCVAFTRLAPWGCGAIAGGLACLNPVAALSAVVYWLVEHRRNRRQIGVFAAMAFIVVLPWMVRNYLVLGAIVPIRDNFGLELKMAFRNDAAITHLGLLRTVEKPPHPNQSEREACTLMSMGEVAYMNAARAEGLRWIRGHPVAAVGLILERTYLWWFPSREDLVPFPVLTCTITALGVLGLSMMGRLRLPLIALAVSFSVPYYFVQSSWRYAVPVAWIFLLGAGFAAWRAARLASSEMAESDEDIQPLQAKAVGTTE
jgi:hypothetical protein